MKLKTRTYENESTGEATILQEDHYYPFGMRMNGQHYTNTDLLNKFLYNGKELQEQTGYYDYGFRQLDPALGRWHVSDAMAENYMSTSPYAYTTNDPINHIDVMGLWADGSGADNEYDDASLDVYFDNTGAFFRISGRTFDFIPKNPRLQDEYMNSLTQEERKKTSFNEWYLLKRRARIEAYNKNPASHFYMEPIYTESYAGFEATKDCPAIWVYKGISIKGYHIVVRDFDDEGTTDWFSDNQDKANVASGTLTFLSAAEHFAEITDGAGSGIYFKVMGRIVFFVSAGYNAGVILNDVENNNYNHAAKTGLDTYYSAIMTFGGPPGFVFGGIMMLLNNTVGIDNMIKTQGNIQIERADRMNRGDYSLWFWGPGTIR